MNAATPWKKEIETIELKSVCHAFDVSNVIRGFSLTLPQEGRIWVRGGSGVGKSVILRILAGLISPSSGEYLINGKNVSDMSFMEFQPYRLNIGYSFEFGGLMNNRTLKDNLLLPLLYHRFHEPEEIERRVSRFLHYFRIEKFQNERPASVPGGIRKAVCVARAYLLDPEVLLLDDPATGMNDDAIKGLEALLMDRAVGRLALITSRNQPLMERIADYELVVSESGAELISRKSRIAV